MIRRKPSKIEVKAEDREELEEVLRSRRQHPAGNSATSAASAAASSSSATSLLQALVVKKPALDPSDKARIIGITHNS